MIDNLDGRIIKKKNVSLIDRVCMVVNLIKLQNVILLSLCFVLNEKYVYFHFMFLYIYYLYNAVMIPATIISVKCLTLHATTK